MSADDYDEDEEDEDEDEDEEDDEEDEELGNITAADLRALAAYGRKHGLPAVDDNEDDEVICWAACALVPLHCHHCMQGMLNNVELV